MSNLLRKLSHNEIRNPTTLARSKTSVSDLAKLEKRLSVC